MNKPVLLLLLLQGLQVFGQEAVLIDHIVEQLIEYDEEQKTDPEMLRNQLVAYLINPLNLNQADKEEINACLFLSFIQKIEILDHRQHYGNLLCIQELQVLAHFDIAFIRLIAPFVSTTGSVQDDLAKSFREGGVHRIRITAKTDRPYSAGYLGKTPYYTGSPYGIDVTYAGQLGKQIKWGLRLEKDAGESALNPQSGLPDHLGYYLAYSGDRMLKRFCLGDYSLNIGQGLSLSNAYGSAKAAWITSIKNTGAILSPFSSANENASLRGLAVQIAPFSGFSTCLFISRRKRDAYVFSDSAGKIFTYNINEASGLHRSGYELGTKNRLQDLLLGACVEYTKTWFSIGLSMHTRKWSPAVQEPTEAYEQFHFYGNSYTKASVYYDMVQGQANLFGEFCISNGKRAQVHGVLMSAGKLDMSLLYRNYEAGVVSNHNQGISENSKAENEKGLLLGLNFKPSKHFELMFHADVYRFSWLKYNLEAPSYGHEYWLELHCKPLRGLELTFRIKEEEKELQLNNALGGTLMMRSRTNFRIHAKLKKDEFFEVRIRYELNHIRFSKISLGELLFIEPIWYSQDKVWKLAWRLSLGTIDDYDARIYAYETTPSGTYPLFNHYFSGMRNYIYVKKRFRYTEIQCKASLSHHSGAREHFYEYRSTGSGTEQRLGSNKFTFVLQYKINIR